MILMQLIGDNHGNDVKLHDIIGGMALWIASDKKWIVPGEVKLKGSTFED